jgi:predicted metal-dependent hydrolase
MKEYKINDLNLLVEIEYKRKNRRIYIRPQKPNIVIIRTPIKLTDAKINEILLSSYKFIKRVLEKDDIIKEEKLHLFGFEYELKEIDDESSYVESDGKYIIIHKNENDDIKKLVSNYYIECLRHFINRYLEEAKTKLNINRIVDVKYKDVKTYYGVCFPKKNLIIFSSKLAKYDPILIKSVIYHELAHFYFLNHQQGFYKLLENVFPNYKYYQHKLRSIKYNDKY